MRCFRDGIVEMPSKAQNVNNVRSDKCNRETVWEMLLFALSLVRCLFVFQRSFLIKNLSCQEEAQ